MFQKSLLNVLKNIILQQLKSAQNGLSTTSETIFVFKFVSSHIINISFLGAIPEVHLVAVSVLPSAIYSIYADHKANLTFSSFCESSV